MTAILENWAIWVLLIGAVLLCPGLAILVMIFERQTKRKREADEKITA